MMSCMVLPFLLGLFPPRRYSSAEIDVEAWRTAQRRKHPWWSAKRWTR